MLNQVVLIGRLTAAPQKGVLKDSETPVAEFTLALNGGADGKNVSFIDCVVYRGWASNLPATATKGATCMVAGKLRQERWESEDGQKRRRVRVVADQIRVIQPKEQT